MVGVVGSGLLKSPGGSSTFHLGTIVPRVWQGNDRGGTYSLRFLDQPATHATSLRIEVTKRHVRVSLVEPGAVNTELATHVRAEVRSQLMQRFVDMERLEAGDIADAIAYIVTRPRRVAVNEMLVRPTEQEN